MGVKVARPHHSLRFEQDGLTDYKDAVACGDRLIEYISRMLMLGLSIMCFILNTKVILSPTQYSE